MDGMRIFMGYFFVIVAILKIADWKGFVAAYQKYDLLAMRLPFYGWLYPLIELGLGIAYLSNWQIKITAEITFVIMVIGVIGVARNLLSEDRIRCACLGTLINVPLTKFTFVEDLLMAGMALVILLN